MKTTTYTAGFFTLSMLMLAGTAVTLAAPMGHDKTPPSVANMDNGVQLTFVGLTEQAEARLIERKTKMAGRHEGVSIAFDTSGDDLVVSITSTDEAEVTKIQEKANQTPEERQAEKELRKAERGAFRDAMTKTVTNLDNGVQVTLSSDDAEVVAKIQNSDRHENKEKKGIVVTKTLTDTGVMMTITSDDVEQVAKIQHHAERRQDGEGKPQKRGGKKRGGSRGMGGHNRQA